MLVSEQYPKGLGHTVAELAERLPEGAEAVEKLRFSACGVEAFDAGARRPRLPRLGGRAASRPTSASTRPCTTCWPAATSVHVAGGRGLVAQRRPTGPSASRRWPPTARRVTSAEMALFEMLEVAGSPEFKAISKLVR